VKNPDKKKRDSESILIALDQISQTMEVMTNVVEKLRDHFMQHPASGTEPPSETSNYVLEKKINQTIH
jgi:hypothetical protein